MVYGKPGEYNGEDLNDMREKKKDMLPYTFIAELKDSSQLKGLKEGDMVKIKGKVASRGDNKSQFQWKLYEGEIIEKPNRPSEEEERSN